MSNSFCRDALNEPIDLGFTPTEIEFEQGGPPALPAASPPPAGPVCGRWLNPQQSSRLARALPDGEWKIRWQVDKDVGTAPVGLQQAGDRIVLHCEDEWELFDAAGQHVADGQVGPSDVFVDPGLGLFYTQQYQANAFQADRLADGARCFVHILGWANGFHRSFMGRLDGNRLAVAGYHRIVNPEAPPPPEVSGIEVWALGDPVEADEVDILVSGQRTAVLCHTSRRFLVAQLGEAFVVAVKDGVYAANADLNLTSGMTGQFTPELLSLDEAGRIHLVVTEYDGLQAYWLLTPQGKMLSRFVYPRESQGEIHVPPVVGYDHSVYLFTNSMVQAISPKGEDAWESELGGRLGGAAVSGDDRLLVAAGNSVSTFEVEEQGDQPPKVIRKPLVTLEGHSLATAPILTADGHLLVASKQTLFCLEV